MRESHAGYVRLGRSGEVFADLYIYIRKYS